jgi:hypothetical protein
MDTAGEQSGTPSFLIKLLKQDFRYDLNHIEAGSSIFDSFSLDNLDWKSLLFQTGYLTIQSYDAHWEVYTLGYPNQEVRDSIFQHLPYAELMKG